jgi:hypothetical protein
MSDNAELARRLRQIDDSWPAICGHMLDTITESATALNEAAALEAENAKLREALEDIASAATAEYQKPLLDAFTGALVLIADIARAALTPTKEQ